MGTANRANVANDSVREQQPFPCFPWFLSEGWPGLEDKVRTRLYEECPSCHETRHSLLPACLRCADVKALWRGQSGWDSAVSRVFKQSGPWKAV